MFGYTWHNLHELQVQCVVGKHCFLIGQNGGKVLAMSLLLRYTRVQKTKWHRSLENLSQTLTPYEDSVASTVHLNEDGVDQRAEFTLPTFISVAH